MKKINIGLIGAGFMGRIHATAYRNVSSVFGQDIVPVLDIVADVEEENAKALAQRFGFQRWTTDWREVTKDPSIDLIDITTPNSSHCPIAMDAARHGKHVYCEKPLALDADEAKEATRVVEEAGVVSAVGFNYIQNPLQAYAKTLIQSGELGRVVNFRGSYDQDYYAEDDTMHEWRFLKSASASGALGDLGAHIISLCQYLVGDIVDVCGKTQIIYPQRPDPAHPDKMLPVENDDLVQFMFQCADQSIGTIFSNRVACGRKMSLEYEIQLTRGAITFTQERQNELKVYRHDDPKLDRGFKTVQIAPGHGEFEHFFSGAAIGLGYADMKTIEAYHVLQAIAQNKKDEIDFRFGCKINMVIDAVLESAKTSQWVKVK